MTTKVVALFGAFDPPSVPWLPMSPRAWTLVGMLAIPLWATWPALVLKTLEMPAFECLTIAFLFAWIILRKTKRAAATMGSGQELLRTWVPAIACALGLSGSNAFHILATHYIPAAEANLISYLWPVMIVAIGAAFGMFHLRSRQVIGLAFGFGGAVILLGGGARSLSFVGIGLALFSRASWALYCLFRLKLNSASGAILVRGYAISAVFRGILHFKLEPTVAPSIGGVAAAAAVGIVPLAFGNLIWDESFRRGDSQPLAVMAYATPLCSALLLASLGLESFTWSLAIGAIVIVCAGVLSRADA